MEEVSDHEEIQCIQLPKGFAKRLRNVEVLLKIRFSSLKSTHLNDAIS